MAPRLRQNEEMPRASTPRTLPAVPAHRTGAEALSVRPRFPHVDALRAIAALAILGTHAAFFAGAYGRPGLAAQLAARLEVGVSVFFVISGFLLYRPFVAAHLTGLAVPRTWAYTRRRLARIVPAYWLALTVIALATPIAGVGLNAGALRYYLFGQIYDTDTIGYGLTQAWSLCVEITFYAFLPLWAWGVRFAGRRTEDARSRLRVELVALALLGAFSVLWKVAVLALQDDHGQVLVTPWLISLPAHLDEFAIGMALAVMSVRHGELAGGAGRVWRTVARYPALAWLAAGAAFVTAATGLGISGRFLAPMSAWQYGGLHALYAVVGACLFAPAVIGDPGRGALRRVLAWAPLPWLGTVSYGIYLWHDAVLNRLSAWGWGDRVVVHAYVWWPAGALAGAALCAAVSWYALERPLLDRVHRRPRPAVTPAPVLPAPAPAARTPG
jgi:peptidoglycan/LPS O-acetylase OafA/YrhL